MPAAGNVFVSSEFITLTDISVALEGFRKEEILPITQSPRSRTS
jgi:hypothetical protein